MGNGGNPSLSVGIDIIEIDRIRRAVDRWGWRFLERVYTLEEIELFATRPASLAARFAAKEAVMKALGGKMGWREIEVLRGPRGEPVLRLYGRALRRAQEKGARLTVSLSHSREYAIASVVGQG